MKKELFNISEVNSSVEEVLTFSAQSSESADNLIQISCRAKEIGDLLFDELTENKHIDFCTAGELSIHHLLIHALSVTGPADVYISTWAIKEEPARALLFLKEAGKIKQLFGVFDYRIKTLDAKHFHLIEKAMTKYELTKNHAKVVVVIGQNLSISIVSSANLSNNPRIEAGFISTCKPTVEFHKQWMDKVLSGQKVY